MSIEEFIKELDKKKTQRLVVSMPIEIHNEIKSRSALRGITIKKYVLRAIMECIKKEKQYE